MFSNSIALITFDQAADERRFKSRVEIEHRSLPEPGFPLRGYAATYPYRYDNDQEVDLRRSATIPVRKERSAAACARSSIPGGVDTQEPLVRITRALKQHLAYQARAVHGAPAPTETLALGCGTCRDVAVS